MKKSFFIVLLLSVFAPSVTRADVVHCEARWFCHDIGMPQAGDETSFFLSDMAAIVEGGLSSDGQTYVYDYGGPAPKIVWSPACDPFNKEIEEYLDHSSDTECTRIHNDGTYTPPWN